MRIGIVYCKNCGARYNWQASGNHWALDTPEKYNDHEYCPECKKAIIDALELIEKKSVVKWIKTDLVDLETLKKWKEEMLSERKLYVGDTVRFPYAERVFASLVDFDHNDITRHIHIQGREIHKDKFFHCSYWEKSNEVVSITTKVRVDMNDNILNYEMD
jgi:hypothetical protein